MSILAGGIISGIGALGKLFSGGGQKRRARKMLAGLKDPGYTIPDEFKTNLGEAENMSRVGLPSEQYNLAGTNIQRGTQAGLRQLGRMSNPFAAISSLQKNMLQAMGYRREYAGQKLAQQQYAQQGYMNKVNQANALLGAGMQNQSGAFSDLGKIGIGIMSAKEEK